MIFLGQKVQLLSCIGLTLFALTLRPVLALAADSSTPMAQPLPQSGQANYPNATNILTLDDALLIALDNHPSLKAARERIAAQQAVLGQQMAAYYPIITNNNRYQTGTQSGTTGRIQVWIGFLPGADRDQHDLV